MFAAAVGIFLCLVLVWNVSESRKRRGLPPGPTPLPIIGNLHQLPKQKAYIQFREWIQEYGPIMSFKLGSGNLVVLNKASMVRDLFDRRSSIYSSRPPQHIGTEVITRDNTHLLLMPFGPAWKAQRKQYQSVLLSAPIINSIRPLQAAESTVTLRHLTRSPERWFDHIRRYSSAVILSSVFGTRGPEFESPYVQRLFHVQDDFTAILETGATPPIDIFPVLKYLPTFIAPWRKWALDIRSKQRALYFELLDGVKQRLSAGRKKDCFMDKIVEDTTIDDEHLAYIGGVMMEGGSDSTAGTLLTFVLAMARYPRVLKKLQETVDHICGDSRAPTFEDIDRMPYVKHLTSELIRWRPVAAEGVPHVLIQDDIYGNYRFPKDTIFLANTWAIHHDPEYYETPEDLIPERYEKNELGFKDKSLVEDGLRPTYGFGAGRRVCPAQKLAENSLHINIAKLAWAFDILPGVDPDTGAPLKPEDLDVSPETAWRPGFITAPKEFPAVFKLRSPKHGSVIDMEFGRASNDVLSRYED